MVHIEMNNLNYSDWHLDFGIIEPVCSEVPTNPNAADYLSWVVFCFRSPVRELAILVKLMLQTRRRIASPPQRQPLRPKKLTPRTQHN